jgi:serine acetyltransferase/GT2 family glycosyltransferase
MGLWRFSFGNVRSISGDYSMDNSGIALSVIIATYNRSGLITALLGDLLGQDFPREKLELVVTNDGSKDDTSQRLREFKGGLPAESASRLILIDQENQGQAKARQAGVEASRGEVLLFIDDDMRLPDTGFLKNHLRHHTEGARRVVLGTIVPPRSNPRRRAFEYFYERSIERMYERFRKQEARPRGLNLYTGNVSLPRSVFLAAGGFSTSYRHAEDKELGLRIEARTQAEFIWEPGAVSEHFSNTPSFASFGNRAYEYGLADCRIQDLYPERLDIGPGPLLTSGGVGRRVLCSLFKRSGAIASLFVALSTGAAKLFGALGLRGMAANFSAVVFLARYVRGVLKGLGSRRAVQELEDRYLVYEALTSTQWPGKSLLRDLNRDLRVLLHLEKRPYRAKHIAWALFGYDAYVILAMFRWRKWARKYRVPFLNRLLRGLQSALYGLDLATDIELGYGVYFVHSHAVVVGGNAKVGAGTRFLGSNTVGTAKENGYPEIGRNVLISCGARVLGPIRVGDGASVGANAVVLSNVPEGATAVGIPARVVSRSDKAAETAQERTSALGG